MEVIGFDAYNQNLTGDVSMTLTAIKTNPHHVPCVVIIDEIHNRFRCLQPTTDKRCIDSIATREWKCTDSAVCGDRK